MLYTRTVAYQELLNSGCRALEAWAWTDAKVAFEAALAENESAEALEGLGVAAFWLDDATTAITARERSCALFRECGDAEGAARLAAGIADAILMFRGEPAVAAGWLQRGRSALADHPDSPVLSWIDVLDAFISMAYERNVDRALEIGEAAVDRARQLGDVETEMLARCVLGVVLVSAGRFADGMRMQDEAAAAVLAGDVRNPEVAGNICCALVTASVRMRDFDRLAQWSRHVMELSGRWSNRAMFSYPRT